MRLDDIPLLRQLRHKDLVNFASVPFNRAYIQGGVLTYNSTEAFDISDCELNINGTVRSFTGGTYTSTDNLRDLAGDVVDFGTDSGRVWLYLYWNGSATVLAAEKFISGDIPVWDSEFGYWKEPTVGIEARRIGGFNLSVGNIITFTQIGNGNDRWHLYANAQTGLQILNVGTATSATNVTLTPTIVGDDDFIVIHPRHGISSGTNVFVTSLLYSEAAGGGHSISLGSFLSASGGQSHRFANEILKNSSGTAMSYLVNGTNAFLSLWIAGFGYRA